MPKWPWNAFVIVGGLMLLEIAMAVWVDRKRIRQSMRKKFRAPDYPSEITRSR